MRKWVWLAALAFPLGGCCAISCGDRLPNSYVKVSSSVAADCVYEDKLGQRKFSAPGQVLGMPKNAPGKLVCQAEGFEVYSRTLMPSDWQLLTSLSNDPDAVRYYSEVEAVFVPVGGGGKN